MSTGRSKQDIRKGSMGFCNMLTDGMVT